VSIFDRFFGGSGWKNVENLPEDFRRDMCMVVAVPVVFPAMLTELLLNPTFKILEDMDYRYTPTRKMEQYFIDEASIAILKSCLIPDVPPIGLRRLDWKSFRGLISLLYLTEISQRRRDVPVVLEEVEYSDDPFESQAQFLVKLTNSLRISDAMAPSLIKIYGFNRIWMETSVSFVGGLDLMASRQSTDQLVTHAERAFKSLSYAGREVVKNMAIDLASLLATKKEDNHGALPYHR
jgi:hypothetical protein